MFGVVAVCAGKGGVLKTTLACHLAAAATAHHRRVLLIDADPQGNAALDLGYDGDGGRGLANSLLHHTALTPIRDVRPGLDVVAGGRHLDHASAELVGRKAAPSEPHTMPATRSSPLGGPLHAVQGTYGLVVIDCPARELAIRHAVLGVAHHIIVPSSADRASCHGLADLAASITEVRNTTNPALDVLAIVAGPIPTGATNIRAQTIEDLGTFIGDPDLVLAETIGYCSSAARGCRANGLLSHEWASQHPNPGATRLANDWHRATAELLRRHQATTPPPSTQRRLNVGPSCPGPAPQLNRRPCHVRRELEATKPRRVLQPARTSSRISGPPAPTWRRPHTTCGRSRIPAHRSCRALHRRLPGSPPVGNR